MKIPPLHKQMFVPFDEDYESLQYSPFDNWTSEEKSEILSSLTDPTTNKAVGALMGMVLGDTMGAPLEFLSVEKQGQSFYNPQDQTFIKPYNKFQLKKGQWTDDASMGLCIADSLLLCKGYDGADIRRRFWQWWEHGYNNAFRFDNSRWSTHSVGLGMNISKSLQSLQKEPVAPIYIPTIENNDSGNGSLMRLAPIPIYFSHQLDLTQKYAIQSSLTTHPGITASDACSFVGYVIASAIHSQNSSIQEFLDDMIAQWIDHVRDEDLKILLQNTAHPDSTESFWRWKDSDIDIVKTLTIRGRRYNGYPVSGGYFFAYSLDALALSLHCLYTTDTAMDAIHKAINFLGDADSTGSITGQIAGAFYGYDQLDTNWIASIHQWANQDIELRGILLHLK